MPKVSWTRCESGIYFSLTSSVKNLVTICPTAKEAKRVLSLATPPCAQGKSRGLSLRES